MDRLQQRFDVLRAKHRAGLTTFITAGDPDLDTCQQILYGLPDAGADIIEIGIPFSDPMADGPAIQASSYRALKSGMSLKKVLSMVKSFRQRDKTTPVVLMGYYNPIYVYGVDSFAKDAANAGVDGIIVVDLPTEIEFELTAHLDAVGIHLVHLVAPTTSLSRLQSILDASKGFIYYVSVTGVTGTKKPKTSDVKAMVHNIRKISNIPVAIGFGIKEGEQIEQLSEIGDAVVIGSALVNKIYDVYSKSGGNCFKTTQEALALVKHYASFIPREEDPFAI